MDTYDANNQRVNAITLLDKSERMFLTVIEAAYKGRDEEKLKEMGLEIRETFRTLYDVGRELKQALDARWRELGAEIRAVYTEIKAQYPGFIYDWNRDLPHYNPMDRHDLLYLLTSTIADITIHDYDRPEAQDEVAALRGWVQRLEALNPSKE